MQPHTAASAIGRDGCPLRETRSRPPCRAARDRLSARVSPQIPAPIMRISSNGMASVTDHGSAERALFEMPLRGSELAEDEHGTGSDQHGNSTGEENRRNMPFRAQHHPPEDRTYD